MKVKLTAEVKIDGGGHLAHLILSFDLVEPRVRLDHVVQLEHHQKLVVGNALDPEKQIILS